MAVAALRCANTMLDRADSRGIVDEVIEGEVKLRFEVDAVVVRRGRGRGEVAVAVAACDIQRAMREGEVVHSAMTKVL